MSVTVSIHCPHTVEAKSFSNTHWVTFRKGGSHVNVFCPNAEVARATAAAWNDALAYSQAEVQS